MTTSKREHSLEHSWESEYTIDEGVYFTFTLRLKLYYSPALDKYVVSGRGADSTTGRHWNREGIPDELYSHYSDALHAYQRLASLYAPPDVVKLVSSDVARELKKEARQ